MNDPQSESPLPDPPQPAPAAQEETVFHPWVTYGLVAANGLAFLGMLLSGPSYQVGLSEWVLKLWGALWSERVLGGEYWRLLASVFLHANPPHLVLNCYALYWVGGHVEYVWGRPVYLALYLLLGIVANIPYVWSAPFPWAGAGSGISAISVGASGAIFGLAGLLAALGFVRRRTLSPGFRRLVRVGVLPFIVLNLFLGALIPQVNNVVHVSGLAAGLLAGLVAARCVRPALPTRLATAAGNVLWAGSTLVLAWTVAAGVTFQQRTAGAMLALQRGTDALLQGRIPESRQAFEEAVSAVPEFAPSWYVLGMAALHGTHGDFLGEGTDREAALHAFGQFLARTDDPPGGSDERRFAAAVLAWGRDDLVATTDLMRELERAGWEGAIDQLAAMLDRAGRSAEAISLLEKQLAAADGEDLERALALNSLAWMLLTCEDSTRRDDVRAGKLALEAVELSAAREPSILDTLAEACWRTGQSSRAVALIDQALALDPPNRAYYEAQRSKFRTRHDITRAAYPRARFA